MNIERVHAIALEIKSDLADVQVVQLIKQLSTHLQNVVNQPQQPTHQEQLNILDRHKLDESFFSKQSNYRPT